MENQMLYSPSKLGFYCREVNGSNIPEDAIEVPMDQYEALISASASGFEIHPGEDGFPVAVPPPAPSDEAMLALASQKRDMLLREAATRIAPLQDAVDLDMATTDEVESLLAWKQYRIALNRMNISGGDVVWPTPPA
ncbi:tail fiber assembly protein [Cupriavidus respiraculi]|uniref:Tail fiber assembly protein n=1 Tax=Cupriavidus respiraculi TaxID=195930 RepID=A0ABN7YJ67_9BURK|nr:tail fiber assembly protein [Cupriavidus respiraculi]CAG9173028.1 hypothetical protein LMG21510_02138 [Cupriavidus respiraculi]